MSRHWGKWELECPASFPYFQNIRSVYRAGQRDFTDVRGNELHDLNRKEVRRGWVQQVGQLRAHLHSVPNSESQRCFQCSNAFSQIATLIQISMTMIVVYMHESMKFWKWKDCYRSNRSEDVSISRPDRLKVSSLIDNHFLITLLYFTDKKCAREEYCGARDRGELLRTAK